MSLGSPDWDSLAAIATVVATFLAAFSARQSAKATKILEREIEVTRRASEFELLAEFESQYRDQYDGIADAFGPWPGPSEDLVDREKRKVAHSMLSSLLSIYLAEKNSLVDGTNLEFSSALFAEWLQNPEAKRIWQEIFRNQDSSWPDGFVEFVDEWLKRPSPWDNGSDAPGTQNA